MFIFSGGPIQGGTVREWRTIGLFDRVVWGRGSHMGESCRTAGRTAALLVNTGSPSAPTPKAVKAYLSEFLMDPCVRPMPAPAWWLILHGAILPKRQHASAAKYREIWTAEGSPLLTAASHLASRTESLLRARHDGPAPLVRAAMSYGEPSIAGVLSELKRAGVDGLVVIPLYPQSAKSTSGSVLLRVREELERASWSPEVVEVGSYCDEPLYLDAVAAKIRAAGFDAVTDRIVFSFHSVPVPDVAAGDTYPEQVDRTCNGLAKRLGLPRDHWACGYQSPFEDNRRWMGPYTVTMVGDVVSHARRRAFMVCPGFSLDCLETLYDVEHEFRPLFEAAARKAGEPGRHSFTYVPCLNADDSQVELMAHLIEGALE